MATDWAAISKAVQDFYEANGWWATWEEIQAMQAATPTPTPTPTPKPAAPAPTSATIGTGSDTLVLKISQDAWQGSAQYKVLVDGVQIGGTLTASALHGSGQSDAITVKGNWAAGAHKVTVEFLNDAWGGTDATDRNLYLDGATYNGGALGGVGAALKGAGPTSFSFTEAAASSGTGKTVTAGSGSDTLVLKITQDAWQGDAQFTVEVDDVHIGGVHTASALRGSGQADTLTLKGEWNAGQHRVEVKFLNDGWGGSAGTDRNLYVEGATYNGQAVAGAKLSLMGAGVQGFGITEGTQATTPTPPPAPQPPAPPSEFAATAMFSDDFNGTALDAKKWPIVYGNGVYWNGAFQWDRNEVSVSNGTLNIGMEKQASGIWDVGGLSTNPTAWQPGFGFTYGKVEIRAKVSQEVWGSGPVFLLWPESNDHWPPEVDILETPKGKGMFTNHWAGPSGEDQYHPTTFDLDYSQWHTYGLEWTPERLTMTVDGKVMVNLTDYIPHEAMSIGLQGHIGNASEEWYGGSPNGSGVNRIGISVDYVKVYDYIG